MLKTIETILLAIATIIIISLSLLLGYTAGKDSVHCPELRTDTIFKYDTVTRVIHQDHFRIKRDTTIITDTIPAKIDTLEILKSYFSKHVYAREWRDSLVSITLQDTISQNIPLASLLSYQILRPQQIINNSVTNKTIYNRYVYAGMSINSVDLKLTSLDLLLANPKWYMGAGYIPGIRGVNLRAGATICTFKKIRQ